jgi:hypothetical protein
LLNLELAKIFIMIFHPFNLAYQKIGLSNVLCMKTFFVNENSKHAKAFIEYARKFSFVQIVRRSAESAISKEVRKALREVKAGKRKSIEKLFKM